MPVARQDESDEHREVVRGVRVSAGQPVHRHRQRTGAEVGFGIGQRRAVWIENVRVEDMPRILDERAGHPGDVPDGELAVGVVDSADVRQLEGDGIGQRDGKQRAADRHCGELPPAWSFTWPAGPGSP